MVENENIQNPTVTPTPTPAVVKPTIVGSAGKKGRKLSPKVVVLGCVAFIVVFIIGLFGALYLGLQNPGKLSNIGIEPANAKSLLMIIASVFFGVIFLFGFGFFGLNTYRLIRNRSGKKGKYLAGIFLGLLLLAVSIGLGAVAIIKVQSIKVDAFANTDDLVIPYLLTSSPGTPQIQYAYAKAPGIHMIAPLDIAFQVNETIVNVKYRNVAGANTPLRMTLDCGNGTRDKESQKVAGVGYIGGTNAFFDSTCLYTKKGTYTPKITFEYRDAVKQQNQIFTLDAGTVTIEAEMNLSVDNTPLQTNDNNSELIVGDAPARLQVDAKDIFSELGLSDSSISWDMESDGTPDKENKVNFGYNYIDPQLYMVSYRFPNDKNLPNLQYHFYLRVNQSDTPRCSIGVSNDGNTYNFSTLRSGGENGGKEVNSYRWEIYDIDAEKNVQSIPARTDSIEYTFEKQGNYTARLVFKTVDNAQGLCESEVLHAGAPKYDVKYTILYKRPGQTTFSSFPSTGTISQNKDRIVIDSIPIDIQLNVTNITPKPVTSKVTVKLDNEFISKQGSSKFEGTISEKKNHTLTIIVEDEQGTKSEKVLDIVLNQSVIQGVLKADIYNGVEPLTVSLDASTTKLNSENDEIIYFTWEFGDGKTAKNVSQGKISHVYTFDQVKQIGQYIPRVTVTTKQGYTATFAIDTPISVIRKTSSVDLTMPSHPAQVAKKDTNVMFEMTSDGPISKISWEFGEGKTFVCNDRSCANIVHSYSKVGNYIIRVIVEYQDRPSASDTIKLKVE